MPNPTLFASGTQLCVISTEHFLSSPAVAGTFVISLDLTNLVAGDVLEARVYQKTLTGGAVNVLYFMPFYGVQPTDDIEKVSVPVGNDLVEANALRFSILQTFGVGKNVPWKVLQYT